MRIFTPRPNSVFRYATRRLRVTVLRHWRHAVMAGVCTIGAAIVGAGLGAMVWFFIACAAVENMSRAIPLASIH